jgi:hypothetical protein
MCVWEANSEKKRRAHVFARARVRERVVVGRGATFCSSALIIMVRPKPAVMVDTMSAPRIMHSVACPQGPSTRVCASLARWLEDVACSILLPPQFP